MGGAGEGAGGPVGPGPGGGEGGVKWSEVSVVFDVVGCVTCTLGFFAVGRVMTFWVV